MFKFKLQDNQREEHFIPNWNFMPKTKKKWWKVVCLVGTVWCLGLLKELFDWIEITSVFLSIVWSWFIAQEWKRTDNRLIILLTKNLSFIILGFKYSHSPSSEKKRRQRLKMSLEAKEAQREKSKVAMQTRRELETKEQIALAKDKHREKKRLKMRKTRQAEWAVCGNGWLEEGGCGAQWDLY